VLAHPLRHGRQRPCLARPPSLSHLAHVLAVLAARLWLQAVPAYANAGAWWRCERDIRAALPSPRVGTPHVAESATAASRAAPASAFPQGTHATSPMAALDTH
jgi:hypothetical protein